ncbi:alpha/beta hydrolase fold domain-containing protein [bacterium]|nr:alpha/beta hydrolase fold domain-containing protein [bacterium]
MKRLSPVFSLLAIGCLASLAQAQQISFERLDRNGDGKIVQDELPERAQRLFNRIDTDSDGSVTEEEFNAFEKIRQQMAQRANGNRPGQGPQQQVEGVKIIRDINYGDGSIKQQRLDIAIPEKPTTDKPLPVIVLIHGGGWMGGSPGPFLSRAMPLVREGDYAAVSIGYRLTGVASWPAQINDCQAGLRWVKANAEKYNWDPNRIVLWGSSAGGHLVAFMGVSADDQSVDGKLGPNTDQSLDVAGVVDFFGPTNLLTMGDPEGFARHNDPKSPESALVGGPILERKDVAKAASPINYVSKGDPPFLILHGTKDPTVPFDQSVTFHDALTKAGVDSTFIHVVGGGHGFGGSEINQQVKNFIDKLLLGKEVEVSSKPIEVEPTPRRRPRPQPATE